MISAKEFGDKHLASRSSLTEACKRGAVPCEKRKAYGGVTWWFDEQAMLGYLKSIAPGVRRNLARDAEICEKHRNGATFADLGREYGLNRSRVGQIWQAELRKERRLKGMIAGRQFTVRLEEVLT